MRPELSAAPSAADLTPTSGAEVALQCASGSNNAHLGQMHVTLLIKLKIIKAIALLG